MYICCMSRMLLNTYGHKGSSCIGEPTLEKTHCIFCDYWKPNKEQKVKVEETYEEEEK